MKVTLVYPGITICGFNSYGRDMDSSWISHGLCSISASAKKAGFDVKLIDLRTLKNWEEFENRIKSEKPDIVGITMMSVDYNPAMKCFEIIKKINPGIVTVVGGPHPSICPNEVKDSKNIDHVITGEGEISFVELLNKISDGLKPEKIIVGKPPDINALPFVDRELFSDMEYPIATFLNRPFVTLIAGRGCRYNCNFCQPAERLIFGRKVRRRSVDNVIAELKILRDKYNFKSLLIHDDCLTEDKEWVFDFCDEYKKNKLDQPFVCQSRADLICKNEDLIKKMAKVGLKMLLIGFESGNQRVLDFLRKGTKVEHNYRAAEICRKYGVKIWANYMLGIPTETKEEVMDTIRMIQTIRPDHYSPAFYTPHPGSDLYEYVERNNLSLITSHDSFRRNPDEEKIKGVDYDFLKKAVRKSMGVAGVFYQNNLVVKVKQILSKAPFLYKITYKILSKLFRF